ELSYQIRQQLDGMDYDPDRLQFIESRLYEINQLKRKYGSTVEEIMTYSAKVEDELEQIKNRDQHLSNLSASVQEVVNDLLLEAKELHVIRKQIATKLEKSVLAELKDLYLDKTKF